MTRHLLRSRWPWVNVTLAACGGVPYIITESLIRRSLFLRRGDKAGAAPEFRRFLNLWKNCDRELEPLTDSASAALR